LEILHLTGKGSAQAVAAACRNRVIIVTDQEVTGLSGNPPCWLFDQRALHQTGAVAIDFPDGQPRFVSVRDVAGERPWAIMP
ncbi:MAG: hypothetical protein ACK5II_02245, partial [Paracoccus sp. (in: a-proteobacteria)]